MYITYQISNHAADNLIGNWHQSPSRTHWLEIEACLSSETNHQGIFNYWRTHFRIVWINTALVRSILKLNIGRISYTIFHDTSSNCITWMVVLPARQNKVECPSWQTNLHPTMHHGSHRHWPNSITLENQQPVLVYSCPFTSQQHKQPGYDDMSQLAPTLEPLPGWGRETGIAKRRITTTDKTGPVMWPLSPTSNRARHPWEGCLINVERRCQWW